MIALTLTDFSTQDLFKLTDFFHAYPGTCLLYSGGSLDTAKTSYLGLFPFHSIVVRKTELTLKRGTNNWTQTFDCPWIGLKEIFFDFLTENPELMAFGWFGYEMAKFTHPFLKENYRVSSTPDAYWQCCAITLCLNHDSYQASIQINLSSVDLLSDIEKKWVLSLQTIDGWKQLLARHSLKALPLIELPSIQLLNDCKIKRENYLNKVNQAKEWIFAGEIYQINLSQKFEFERLQYPFEYFRQINKVNPSPFSVYFHTEEVSLISSSPERFLKKEGSNLETRPIKGTIRRGDTLDEDLHFKNLLLSSIKERAELLMITDLMRSDLGKISQIGSVATKELWRCEAYTNVFHLLSIIHSICREDLSALEMIQSCFPGGSITGCPKIRAIQLIDELEEIPRGIYTGAIGYLTGNGNFDLNIAIRTLVNEKEKASIHLGSGIVIDSDPEKEYQETLYKGFSLFSMLSQFKQKSSDE